jgi:hypothetical protein
MNRHGLVPPDQGVRLSKPRRFGLGTGLPEVWRFTVVALTLALIAALVVVLRYVVFEHFHGDDHLLRAALEAIGVR